MASRHVDVNERRLRPVYDALDSMNNKKAIQQADKILKKQKDLHCAKALKSIALLRLGRTSESEKLMNEVKEVQPCDEPTLQAMTICFREMEKCSEISAIYEEALKKNPKNEELTTHLFMSYVRTLQFKKQQQTAMNLYKSCQKNPYYFWAVMSNVMQAYVCQDDAAKFTMLLTLAERMIEKLIKEEKIEAEAEVVLYLSVLELQEKYEKALEVLDGKLGEFLTGSCDVKRKRMEYLTKLGKWSEVNVLFIEMIQNSRDEWSHYKGYLNSLFMLLGEQYVPPTDDNETTQLTLPHHSVAMAVNFLNDLKQKELEKGHKRNRGPFLARLELLRLVRDKQDLDTGCDEKPLDLLVEYFTNFADKSLCFSDLISFFDLLEKEEMTEFLDLCKSSIPAPEGNDIKENIKILTRKISLEKMSRYLGFHDHLSVDEKLSLAKNYMSSHKEGLEFGKDLLSTDFQYSDEFALLAAHLLLDCCDKSENSNSVHRVLITLESALKTSPSNFQLKLLLCRLYASIGAVGPCVTYMESMDIKHIAHDTLGYNITRYAEPLGHFESAMAIYSVALKLYQSNKKDTMEYVIASYKYGSFEKIFEFINFKERLENSFTFASVVYEETFLEIMLSANSTPVIRELFMERKLAGSCPHSGRWTDKLRDNRDLDIMKTWDKSYRQSSQEMKEMSFRHEILWLKLRVLIIRALGLVTTFPSDHVTENDHVMSSSQATNGVSERLDNLTQCSNILEELQNILHEVDSCNIKSIKFPIYGPLQTRWRAYLDGSYDKLLLCLLKITQVLNHLVQEPEKDEKLQEAVELVKRDFSNISTIITDNVNSCSESLTVQDNDKKIFNGDVIGSLVLLLEATSTLLIFVSCFRDSVQKLTQISRSKKKKKMALSPSKQELLDAFKSFLEILKTALSQIYNQLLDKEILHLTEELITFDMNELYKQTDSSLLTEIWEKMQTSYKISVQEISEVMKLKLDFLRTFTI